MWTWDVSKLGQHTKNRIDREVDEVPDSELRDVLRQEKYKAAHEHRKMCELGQVNRLLRNTVRKHLDMMHDELDQIERNK